jgi:hypothetical protein
MVLVLVLLLVLVVVDASSCLLPVGCVVVAAACGQMAAGWCRGLLLCGWRWRRSRWAAGRPPAPSTRRARSGSSAAPHSYALHPHCYLLTIPTPYTPTPHHTTTPTPTHQTPTHPHPTTPHCRSVTWWSTRWP